MPAALVETTRKRIAYGVVSLLLLAPTGAWPRETLTFDSEFVELEVIEEQLVATDARGDRFRMALRDGELTTTPYVVSSSSKRPDDILPDGVVVTGEGDIRRAWLGGATTRYDHAALGDGLEASRLYAVDRNGKRHVYELPDRYVFEDRYPRLVDLDGETDTEVVLIRSDTREGAAVAVYGLQGGELRELTASAPIGLPHRWLNIVGAADFDGNGDKEIAMVSTPHIGGILTVLRQRGDALVPMFEQRGFSNHAYGSRELGMSAVLDLDGNGSPDMAVPGRQRKTLVLATMVGGEYQELARIEHAAPIHSGIHAVDLSGTGERELVYLLDDRTVVVIVAR